MTTFGEVEEILAYFSKKREQYTTKPDIDGNITYLKFDLRDIISVVPEKHMKPLINFYLKNSDRKTLKDFVQKYDEYYRSLVHYAEERRRILSLKKQTMERVNE